jgi:hypothetical protein
MTDVSSQELSHKQEHGFVEKHGVITKRPDRNSVGPESVVSRDRDWDIAGIRHKLEQIRSSRIEEDEEDRVIGGVKDKKPPYYEDFDHAHSWHKVAQGQDKLEWGPDAEDRLAKHEGRWPSFKWFLGKIPFPDRDN